jgi:hypothetical protein
LLVAPRDFPAALPDFEYAARRFERRHQERSANAAREARNAEPIAIAIDDKPTSGPIEKVTK